ncbi:MAG: hypothetical protein JWM77_2729, partial [Rhodospirillales bacterium]|nr:hypothetical protein [Rhodospirillales bacterium]
MSLADQILSTYPGTPTALLTRALELVCELPSLRGWAPENVNFFQHDRAIRVGVQLALLGGAQEWMEDADKLAQAVRFETHVDWRSFAELATAAFLTRIGAHCTRVQATPWRKTPDIVATFGEGHCDIEVVRADARPTHIAMQHLRDDLAAAIGLLPGSFGVAIHCIDTPTESETEEIISSVVNLEPGQCLGVPMRWEVRALSLDDANPDLPAWWPND